MAELLILNRGREEVTSVNEFEKADNKWGRLGLTPDEAFHLTQMASFLKGILFCLGDPELQHDVLQYIGREVEHQRSGSTLYLPTGSEIQAFGR